MRKALLLAAPPMVPLIVGVAILLKLGSSVKVDRLDYTYRLQYLRHSGSINRANLSDLGEDLVNKNRLRSLRK